MYLYEHLLCSHLFKRCYRQTHNEKRSSRIAVLVKAGWGIHIQRHTQIRLGKPERIQGARADATEASIRQWFELEFALDSVHPLGKILERSVGVMLPYAVMLLQNT